MYFGCIDFYLRTNSCIVPNCQNSLQKAIAFPSPNLSFVLLSPVYSSAFPSYQHIELIDGSIRITATPKRQNKPNTINSRKKFKKMWMPLLVYYINTPSPSNQPIQVNPKTNITKAKRVTNPSQLSYLNLVFLFICVSYLSLQLYFISKR